MRSYTTMASHIRPHLKNGLTADDVLDDLWRGKMSGNMADAVTYNGFWMDNQILKGDAIHLFLPDINFCDWLVSCVPELNPDHAEAAQSLVGEDGRCGVLHFPTGKDVHSFAFNCDKLPMKLDGTPGQRSGVLCLLASREDSRGAYAQVILEGDPYEHDALTKWRARLICGIGMYVECFPEAVAIGAPEDIKHPSMHRHTHSVTVRVSESIREPCPGGVTPHFRRGHFRILKSEKFKNKRFKSVFVRQAFVKGHAKTVLAPEEVPA
jgi:hypothetical protein